MPAQQISDGRLARLRAWLCVCERCVRATQGFQSLAQSLSLLLKALAASLGGSLCGSLGRSLGFGSPGRSLGYLALQFLKTSSERRNIDSSTNKLHL